jgi:hypothetical protein
MQPVTEEERRLRKRKQAVLFAAINAQLRSYYRRLTEVFGSARPAEELLPRSEAGSTVPRGNHNRPTGSR